MALRHYLLSTVIFIALIKLLYRPPLHYVDAVSYGNKTFYSHIDLCIRMYLYYFYSHYFIGF